MYAPYLLLNGQVPGIPTQPLSVAASEVHAPQVADFGKLLDGVESPLLRSLFSSGLCTHTLRFGRLLLLDRDVVHFKQVKPAQPLHRSGERPLPGGGCDGPDQARLDADAIDVERPVADMLERRNLAPQTCGHFVEGRALHVAEDIFVLLVAQQAVADLRETFDTGA